MKLIIQLENIKKASDKLLQKKENDKNKFMRILADTIWEKKRQIIDANIIDVKKAKDNKLNKAFIERLIMDEKAISDLVQRLKNTITIASKIGKIIEERRVPSGLLITKKMVPIGVIFIIFESRPEVTIDVAALCIKSGNCAILRGGREAAKTTKLLFGCIKKALGIAGLPKDSITLVTDYKREAIYRLLKETNYIDLVIARGGYEMVKDIQNRSKIPVLAHSSGGARIYVDKSADLGIALKIIINAKISKPAACNSVDMVLIHQDIARNFLPILTAKFKSCNIEIIKGKKAWETEFLDLKIGVKIVRNLDSALDFIHRFTKHHSEGIIAKDRYVIEKFINSTDAASVFINSSTRFHDGGEFGMGTELGIATGKLHARGPVGIRELSTYKWVIEGDGQVRE